MLANRPGYDSVIFGVTDMTNKNADAFLGDGGAFLPSPQPGKPDQLHCCGSNTIFKSGPLSLSSKGIGWTSWKKRWFVLTRTSLVFFRNDPSAVPQKGDEVNLTLGGIDLNNSGSVVVKADKKLLTVLFPDGRDGRAFTLKAETTEDLNEWKTALENALAQAPSAANVVGQNGIFRNDQTESIDNSLDQLRDREPLKSTVIGRPILLALEDADGTPSFLEKALKFIEQHGVKVEGILRQAADVDDVEHRVREYEQGKVEFSAEEDAHIVADCVKHVLRELPSSPVPASCCKALLEACRTERASRVSTLRAAICETFPEPNRRLLQRILLMMRAVASHKAENRMSSSAVAACMAPLLLRALLVGDCEIENDFDVGGDGSVQLLQAAAAANHAQAIVITLLEEYDSLFGEGGLSPDIYADSEESGTKSEDASDVESYDDDDYDDEEDESVEKSDADEEDESVEESDADEDEDDDLVGEANSETANSRANHASDDKEHNHSSSKSSGVSENVKINQVLSSNSHEVSLPQHVDVRNAENVMSPIKTASVEQSNKPAEVLGGVFTDQSTVHHSSSSNASCIKKSITMSNAPVHNSQHHTKWGRTSARKNLSMESFDYSTEDDVGIVTLEAAKTESQNQIAEEVKGNSKLQSDLGKQNKALHQRRLALELDVASLQEQLQEEKNSRATLEGGLKFSPGPLSDLTSIYEKTKADLEELALVEADLTSLEQKVNDLGIRLNLQHKGNYGSALNFCNKPQQILNHETKWKNKPETEVRRMSQFGRSRSKDSHFGGEENDYERKLESTPLPSNYISQNSSKKFGTKKEGANPTSARAKLSFRLNFLKDRRGQIGNDLHNVDNGREFAHSAQNSEKRKGSEFHQPPPSPNTSRGPEIHCVLNQEKGKGSEFRQPQLSPNSSRGSEIDCVSNSEKGEGSEIHSESNPEKGRGLSCSLQIPDKGSGKEGQSLQNSDKMRKSGSYPAQHSERWNQHPQHLDRGKSEGHRTYSVDKGR